jgi:hypothetical protein
MGVGRFNFTWKSAVTVQGGSVAPVAFMRACAAVQLLWQSSKAPMMPPFKMLAKAW